MISNYTMLYSGFSKESRAQSGVALIIDHKWTFPMTNYSFVSDRIISVRLKTNRGHITIVGLYAPVEGRERKKKQHDSTKTAK
jgi:hypothetical protein